MGLDMYLSASAYVYGYEHNLDARFEKILSVINLNRTDVHKFLEVNVTVGYWRKANAIHNWFVKNVQGSNDDCRQYYVSPDHLKELRRICKLALFDYNAGDFESAAKTLPPTEGFFFGSTKLDDGYKADLEHTIELINRCLSDTFKGFDFNYRASW